MKKLNIILILIVFMSCTLHSNKSHAWGVFESDAKITHFIRWEGNTAPVYLRINAGKFCFIPSTEKELIALAMTLYVTKTPIQIHCRDEEVNYGGVNGHKVHRIVAS